MIHIQYIQYWHSQEYFWSCECQSKKKSLLKWMYEDKYETFFRQYFEGEQKISNIMKWKIGIDVFRINVSFDFLFFLKKKIGSVPQKLAQSRSIPLENRTIFERTVPYTFTPMFAIGWIIFTRNPTNNSLVNPTRELNQAQCQSLNWAHNIKKIRFENWSTKFWFQNIYYYFMISSSELDSSNYISYHLPIK